MKVNTNSKFEIVVDGGCRSNGALNADAYGSFKVFVDGVEVRHEQFALQGTTTNNQAEYESLIMALEYIRQDAKRARLSWKVFTDSDLIRKQLANEIRVKNATLMSLKEKATEKMAGLSVEINRKSGSEVKAILGH